MSTFTKAQTSRAKSEGQGGREKGCNHTLLRMINLTQGKNWTTSYLPFTDTDSVRVQKLKITEDHFGYAL